MNTYTVINEYKPKSDLFGGQSLRFKRTKGKKKNEINKHTVEGEKIEINEPGAP